ncbi:MAG: DNA primase [Ktedonobacterales bacterium]|nr:DNA primase [Ktedonobacterales bacterium]
MIAESNSLIERIKRKLDIVEEIGAVVPLKKSGKAFKGLCPFHGERTPSFYVMPDRGSWHCFGCGEGGDIFTFVQKQQGLDFREALALLAERAGIALESGAAFGAGPQAESAETLARKRLRELNEAAAIWYHHQLLQAPEARYARGYLDSRGVSNDSLALWRLGYAPDGDRLSHYLQEQGFTPKELVDAGLARERETDRGGGLYDYFRNRLIFPIRDARGHAIAFGGRELGGGHPKYLNTPQTVLFDKSATLFGLDLARDPIRRANRVIIVEGYLDAIVTHQYGSHNVVACIGSAITEKHIRAIKKLTRRVTLCLDPDAAGESATLRGITAAQAAFDRVVVPVPGPAPERPGRNEREGRRRRASRGMVRFEEQVDAEITVMRLPPHEDPDEFVRRDLAGWQRAIEEALPLIDYLIEAQTADLALDTPQGKMEACRRLLPIIAAVRERTLADEYVGRLARKVRLDKVELRRDLHRARQQLDREARPARPPADEEIGEEEAQPSVEPVAAKYQTPAQASLGKGYSSSHAWEDSVGLAGELMAEQAQAEYCLGLLLDYPQTWPEVYAILSEGDFTGTEARALFAAFASAMGTGAAFDTTMFLDELPEVVRAIAERARARTAGTLPDDDQAPVRAASEAAYRFKRMRLKAEVAELDYLKRDAEQSGDQEALRALLQRERYLLSQRHAIDAATEVFG